MLARVAGVPAQRGGGRPVRVFLSYRRGDAGGYAGRLADALLQRLGPRSVFQDVTAISPGQDYTVAIDRALADSEAAQRELVELTRNSLSWERGSEHQTGPSYGRSS